MFTFTFSKENNVKLVKNKLGAISKNDFEFVLFILSFTNLLRI